MNWERREITGKVEQVFQESRAIEWGWETWLLELAVGVIMGFCTRTGEGQSEEAHV